MKQMNRLSIQMTHVRGKAGAEVEFGNTLVPEIPMD